MSAKFVQNQKKYYIVPKKQLMSSRNIKRSQEGTSLLGSIWKDVSDGVSDIGKGFSMLGSDLYDWTIGPVAESYRRLNGDYGNYADWATLGMYAVSLWPTPASPYLRTAANSIAIAQGLGAGANIVDKGSVSLEDGLNVAGGILGGASSAIDAAAAKASSDMARNIGRKYSYHYATGNPYFPTWRDNGFYDIGLFRPNNSIVRGFDFAKHNNPLLWDALQSKDMMKLKAVSPRVGADAGNIINDGTQLHYDYKKLTGGDNMSKKKFQKGRQNKNESSSERQRYMSWLADESLRNSEIWKKNPADVYLEMLNDDTYDYYSYWKNEVDGNKDYDPVDDHYVDTYKTANHPTFSNESMYSGTVNSHNPKGIDGGRWSEDYYGLDRPEFSSYSISNDQAANGWNIPRAMDYLRNADPGVKVDLSGVVKDRYQEGEQVTKDKLKDAEVARQFKELMKTFSVDPYIGKYSGMTVSRTPNAFTFQKDAPWSWSAWANIPITKDARTNGTPNEKHDDNYGNYGFSAGNEYENGFAWDVNAGLNKGATLSDDVRYANGRVSYDHPKSGLFGSLAFDYVNTGNPLKKKNTDFTIDPTIGWRRIGIGRRRDNEIIKKNAMIAELEKERKMQSVDKLDKDMEEFEQNKEQWWAEREAMRQEKKGGAKFDFGNIRHDQMGYWNKDNQGKGVVISGNNGKTDITMRDVGQDLIGISDKGQVKKMKAGKDHYSFNSDQVLELPEKKGVLQMYYDMYPGLKEEVERQIAQLGTQSKNEDTEKPVNEDNPVNLDTVVKTGYKSRQYYKDHPEELMNLSTEAINYLYPKGFWEQYLHDNYPSVWKKGQYGVRNGELPLEVVRNRNTFDTFQNNMFDNVVDAVSYATLLPDSETMRNISSATQDYEGTNTADMDWKDAALLIGTGAGSIYGYNKLKKGYNTLKAMKRLYPNSFGSRMLNSAGNGAKAVYDGTKSMISSGVNGAGRILFGTPKKFSGKIAQAGLYGLNPAELLFSSTDDPGKIGAPPLFGEGYHNLLRLPSDLVSLYDAPWEGKPYTSDFNQYDINSNDGVYFAPNTKFEKLKDIGKDVAPVLGYKIAKGAKGIYDFYKKPLKLD